jgi:hypothetical protein
MKEFCILCGHNGHTKYKCGYKSQILFYNFPQIDIPINVDFTKKNNIYKNKNVKHNGINKTL